jgi:hypothetical protein
MKHLQTPYLLFGCETKFSHTYRRIGKNLVYVYVNIHVFRLLPVRLITPSHCYDKHFGKVIAHHHLIVSPLRWHLHILLSLTGNLISFYLKKKTVSLDG